MTTASNKLASDFAPASFEQWRGMVEKALRGADFEKRLVARTADGIRIDPLYTRADALDSAQQAVPGAAPYTRGTQAARAGLGWNIAAIHIEPDPAAANAAILEDLEGGVNTIALQIGGPGLPAGKDALSSALKGVMLDACPIALIAGEGAFDAASALMALWTEQKIPEAQRAGSFGADPIGTLAIHGQLSEPMDAALARAVALAKLALPMERVAALSADGVLYHNAGASEAQELACMLATLVAYLRACEKGGIAPAEALPKISVALAADADEFSTIAKLRAARHLVWRVAEASGAGDAAAKVRFVSPTSFRMMAKRDPWTNILRTTIACTGAALGGADSICVLPFTFAIGRPDAFARRVARNVQIVCQEESNLGRVIDPAGGSWYVEQLTEAMAKSAWDIFQGIETKGGMVAALTSGHVQDMIGTTAVARAKAVATGKTPLTGVSAFPLLGDDGVHADPWPAPQAKGGTAAVTVTPLKAHRLGEDFEALRDAADAAGGYTAFVASMGAIIDHNVRTTWVKNYLAAGGIQTLISDGYKTADDAAAAFKASGATAACICSSDALYPELAEPTAKALKAAGAKLVLMACRPGDTEAVLRAAGVDGFLYAGADAIAVLKDLQSKLG